MCLQKEELFRCVAHALINYLMIFLDPPLNRTCPLYANYWICSPWCSFGGSDLDTLFYVQMLFNADHVDEVYILSKMVCGNCLLNIMCYFSKFLTFRVMFRWIPRNFVKNLKKNQGDILLPIHLIRELLFQPRMVSPCFSRN